MVLNKCIAVEDNVFPVIPKKRFGFNRQTLGQIIGENLSVLYSMVPEFIGSPDLIYKSVEKLDDLYKKTDTCRFFLNFIEKSGLQIAVTFNEISNSIIKNAEGIISLAEAHVIAFNSVEWGETAVINPELSANRIKAMRLQKQHSFQRANAAASSSRIRQFIESFERVESRIDFSQKITRIEAIPAGGDATRYTEMLRSILLLDNQKEFDERFSTDEIRKLFGIPYFRHLLIYKPNILDNGRYCLKSVKKLINKAKKMIDFSYMPKALIPSFRVQTNLASFNINFFLKTLFQLAHSFRQYKQENSQHHFFYMVQNMRVANAIQKGLKMLEHDGVFDPKILKVHFLTRELDAIPLEKQTGKMMFHTRPDENMFNRETYPYMLRTSSTGHGPSVIKIANEIQKIQTDESITYSIITLDNSGYDIDRFTHVAQILSSDGNKERNALVNKILERKIGESTRLSTDSPLSEIRDGIRCKIFNEWDYHINTPPAPDNATDEDILAELESIAHEIKELPFTVALVINKPGAAGGGLLVDESNHLRIVDQYQDVLIRATDLEHFLKVSSKIALKIFAATKNYFTSLMTAANKDKYIDNQNEKDTIRVPMEFRNEQSNARKNSIPIDFKFPPEIRKYEKSMLEYLNDEVLFNPMVFAVTIKGSISPDLDATGLFTVTKKNKITNSEYLQAESAASDLFTNSGCVLKRIAFFESDNIKPLFMETKYIQDTNWDDNYEATNAVGASVDIRSFEMKILATKYARIIKNAQDVMLKSFNEDD